MNLEANSKDPFLDGTDFCSEICTCILANSRLYWRATGELAITRSSPKMAYLVNHFPRWPQNQAACCTTKWWNRAKMPHADKEPNGVPVVYNTSRTFFWRHLHRRWYLERPIEQRSPSQRNSSPKEVFQPHSSVLPEHDPLQTLSQTRKGYPLFPRDFLTGPFG